MAEPLRRPGPYIPLSVTFGTGRTGAAIQERFGTEGIGVWSLLLAAAWPDGFVTFRHDQDWAAIGVTTPPSFALKEFLTLLGHRKHTRRTQHGHVIYVELTRWADWNQAKQSYDARQRMARKRRLSERTSRERSANEKRTPSEHIANLELEVELEQESKPKAVDLLPTRAEPDEPEWAAEDDERPEHFQIPEVELKEMPA